MYYLLRLKERIEYWLMLPFIYWGRYRARNAPTFGDYDVFCFFSGFAMGGAEKVNAQWLATMPGKRIIVFFTRRSANDSLRNLYNLPNVSVKDISAFTDDKWRYWNNFIYRGKCSYYINSLANLPLVLIGQCNFGYKLLPHLRHSVRSVEYIHVSEPAFAAVTMPYLRFIHHRVASSATVMNDYLKKYKQLGVPSKYNDRWIVIPTGIQIENKAPIKRSFVPPLQVYYVGRGGPHKRVWLIAEIVRHCMNENLPIQFHLVGPVEDEIPDDVKPNVKFYGIVTDRKRMSQIHQEMDILLMTSVIEGFPLVVMEAMSFGAVPLLTAVNAIPEHVHHLETGFLISNAQDDSAVVQQATDILKACCNDQFDLAKMSLRAFQYAQEHFGQNQFGKQWLGLLNDPD